MDYKTSGVDVEAGRAFVNQIRNSIETTHTQGVLGGIGGFAGCFRLPQGFKKPVLVSGTDGVGTKLELAQKFNFHFGVGIDLVAMCVNDVITNAAQPLFFLDYIATGKLGPKALSEVIEGIAFGCKTSDCALLGGETAEMPGFYSDGKYDLAGFCVGVVEEEDLIESKRVKPGDQIVAIASNGVHSNGFSLVRKVLENASASQKTIFGKDKQPLIEKLLEPTVLYSPLVKRILAEKIDIHGMAHITGGGLPENLPRCLPDHLIAYIDTKTWEFPEIFKWLHFTGDIPETDMWNTFNCGVGFCLISSSDYIEDIFHVCAENGFTAWLMGEVKEKSSDLEEVILGLPI